MTMYRRKITVNWGETDPFGLVYYPHITAWFNDTEHELFRKIGYPIDQMIRNDCTTFVMGEIQFRFINPVAYGDRVSCEISLSEIRRCTLHWDCKAINESTGAVITEGQMVRIYAQINEDSALKSVDIPEAMCQAIKAAEKK